MSRAPLSPDELAQLAARVEVTSLRAVADEAGICAQTVARLLAGRTGNPAAITLTRRVLATPLPEPPPPPEPPPQIEDVHELTGGRCREGAATCSRLCRHVLPTDALGSRCALEVADEGPHTLTEVGQAEGLTRERVRQIEALALARAKRNARLMGLAFEPFEGRHVDVPDEPPGRVRGAGPGHRGAPGAAARGCGLSLGWRGRARNRRRGA